MGVVERSFVFLAITGGNAILFLFHSRVLLEVLAVGNEIAGTGPATDALNLLPQAMQLAMGGIQLIAIVYLLGGLGSQRSSERRPLR